MSVRVTDETLIEKVRLSTYETAPQGLLNHISVCLSALAIYDVAFVHDHIQCVQLKSTTSYVVAIRRFGETHQGARILLLNNVLH